MMTEVNLQNVSLTYHSPTTETLAVNNISLEVSKGELLGLVGPSGCGKTTILSLISSTIEPSQGKVEVCGMTAKQAKDLSGYMLQKDELFGWRTIWNNVLLGLEIKHQKTPSKLDYADKLLKKYNLSEFKDFYPQQLSGGMRQRVALIRTLVLSPRILLLDEPFSALDFQTRLNVVKDVHNIIKSEEKTAIFVTHDISEAISLCDRIVILTRRPCQIHNIVDLSDISHLTPLERREHPLFGKYFDEIWRQLSPLNTEQKNE